MKLKVNSREIQGSKVKKLRANGLIPAVIFGNNKESKAIELNHLNFVKLFEKAGETEIIDLEIEGVEGAISTLVSEIQYHPVKDTIIHVAFQEVNLTEKVRVNIPIEYTGEEEHPLIKSKEALLISVIDKIEVEALPRDLPSEFKVSIESLKEIGDVLTVGDLKKQVETDKVEILIEDDETVIAKLDYAEMQEVVEEEPMSVDDVQTEHGGEKQPEDIEGKEDSDSEKDEQK